MQRMLRREAKAVGLTKYWPLAPCASGHDAERRVSGACVVCERIARRKWAAENPEIAARSNAAAWAKANPERHRANSARWQRENIWYAVQATNERRARKRGAEGHYTQDDIAQLHRAQEGRCAGCGEAKALEVDHRQPISRGGSNWPSNLQLLCRSCNASKGSKTQDEWLSSRSLRSTSSPSAAPATA